jgi:peptide/nickel transport system permease protein
LIPELKVDLWGDSLISTLLDKKNLKRIRDPVLLIPLVPFMLTLFFAIFAELISPYPPLKTGVGSVLSPPSLRHLMGTDQVGSDIFSQVIYGSRTALIVSVGTGLIALFIALIIGLVAGYYGGLIDNLLMRFTDLFLSIPAFIFIIFVLVVFGNSLRNLIIVLGLLSWPIMARIVRSQTLSIREREFVVAAKAIGESDKSIIFREILPNIWPSIIPAFLLEMSLAILVESGISFIGLGDPNVASWGKTLAMASRSLYAGAWWGALFPGLMLFLTILSLNMLGDQLEKVLSRSI